MVPDKRRDSAQGASGRSRRASVKILPANVSVSASPEIRTADGWLEITFPAPNISESNFRYSVGRRYLVVWSDKVHPVQHHFVGLPKAVNPADHILKFTNGVVDARVKLA